MPRLLAELRARLLGAWPSTVAGAALAVLLLYLHRLGADGIRELAGEASALGELLQALTGIAGDVASLLAAWLVLRRGPAR